MNFLSIFCQYDCFLVVCCDIISTEYLRAWCFDLKILLVSDAYTYQTNGVANVVISLAVGLRASGHSVKVLAPSNDHHSFKNGDDYYIRSFPAFYYPDQRFSLVRHDVLLDELESWKPDLVHMHTEGTIAHLGRKLINDCDVPFVMTSHTDYAKFVFGRFSKRLPARVITRAFGKIAYRGCYCIVVPSEKALGFSQLQSVVDRSVVIPNGINLAQYQKVCSPDEKASLFARYGLKDNGKTLIVVSRLSREKNIKEIIRCFGNLLNKEPDSRLLIVGDGPYRDDLELYSYKCGLDGFVVFTGYIKPDLVYKYYGMGDLFVSASTFEVHSLTYLEAMAQGLPLVCKQDPCLNGVLFDGKNGFSYIDDLDFVNKVSMILNDDNMRSQMSVESKHLCDRFSNERFVKDTCSLYENILLSMA